ncbi:MAG: glycoside hydrolase family 3 N-terminal domain-containing protein [Bacteroidota bacterium]
MDEERSIEADRLIAQTAFNAALDSLFFDYDDEVLNLLKPDPTDGDAWVDSMMENLSLDEKIGQLFIINLDGTSQRARERAMEAVEDFYVGGFIVSRAMDPQDVYEQTRTLQEESGLPLFFTADYERGVGRHSNNLTELPSNMGIGATRDPVFAAAAGRLTAIEGKAVGVNMVLAPVVDVNNNPANPIINIRSYSEDPALVGLMASSFVQEAQALGMLTTLKHFPGHGNTHVDTHTSMGTIHGDHHELDAVELYPYRFVFDKEVEPSAVMSAHLWIPAYDEEPLPATFSRNVLHTLLRDTLSFNGLVITDDVRMGALMNDYSFEERTVNPLLAGADMVLTKSDFRRSVRSVRDAVSNGLVSEAVLNRSVRRVLTAKARAGLHNKRFVKKPVLDYLLAIPRGEPLAQATADKAVTLLKNDTMLPLDDSKKVSVIQITNRRNSPSIRAAMDLFADSIAAGVTVLSDVRIEEDPSESRIASVKQEAEDADAVIVVLYLRLASGSGDHGLQDSQELLVDELVGMDKPVALMTLGNPYAVTPFADSEALLIAYEQSLASVRTLSKILVGQQAPRGKLPISVGPYTYGSGLTETLPPQALSLSD